MDNYFNKSGLVALKIWLTDLGIEDLKKSFNQKRSDNLWKLHNNFFHTMKNLACSDEDICYAKKQLSEIKATKRFQAGISADLTAEKIWLTMLAVDVLKKTTDKEIVNDKAKTLKFWLSREGDYIKKRNPDYRQKYVDTIKNLELLEAQ